MKSVASKCFFYPIGALCASFVVMFLVTEEVLSNQWIPRLTNVVMVPAVPAGVVLALMLCPSCKKRFHWRNPFGNIRARQCTALRLRAVGLDAALPPLDRQHLQRGLRERDVRTCWATRG